MKTNIYMRSDHECMAKTKYSEQFDRTLQFQIGKNRLAGFWAEPIQGVGGSVQYPKGWLRECFDKVHADGGVCVADEVQTGFGRTGTVCWKKRGEVKTRWIPRNPKNSPDHRDLISMGHAMAPMLDFQCREQEKVIQATLCSLLSRNPSFGSRHAGLETNFENFDFCSENVLT